MYFILVQMLEMFILIQILYILIQIENCIVPYLLKANWFTNSLWRTFEDMRW